MCYLDRWRIALRATAPPPRKTSSTTARVHRRSATVAGLPDDVASAVSGGNAAPRNGHTADVPGVVGSTVVVGEVVVGVVDSTGTAGPGKTICCREELVGSSGLGAGPVVTGWVEVGCTEVGDGDGGVLDIGGGGFGGVSGGHGGGGRKQMIGGSGPIGSRQIGGSGNKFASNGAEAASRATMDTASLTTRGTATEFRSIETELRLVEDASATG